MSVTLITFNNPCQGLLQGLQHNWLVWFTFFFQPKHLEKKDYQIKIQDSKLIDLFWPVSSL